MAASAIKLFVADFVGGKPEEEKLVFGRLVGLDAIFNGETSVEEILKYT